MNVVCRTSPPARSAFWRVMPAAAFVLALAVPGTAQTPTQPSQQKPAQQPPAQQPPPAQPPGTQQEPQEPPKYEEIVVVSGSKTEEKLINTGATMSVITAPTIEIA